MRVLTMIRKSRRGPLLLCCSLFVTWAMSSPDPTCSRGVKRGSICCSASCGDKCSSKGCSHAGCGAKCCCSSSIEKSDRLCSQNAAPCNLGSVCTYSEGEEYVGNDIKVVRQVSSKAKCCDLCSTHPACKFFTFDASASTCSLKGENAPDTSRPNKACSSGFSGVNPPAPRPPSNTVVEVRPEAVSRTAQSYVCWNLDASRNRQFFDRNLSLANPLAARVAAVAAGLGEAQGHSILRFGGTGNDYLTYAVPGGKPCPAWSPTQECLNMTWWRNTLEFARAAKAKVLFGLSLNTGHDATTKGRRLLQFPQVWDPTNARQLLEWTLKQGLGDVLWGLELGNEQNTQHTGEAIARNFAILHNLTVELWPNASQRPQLLGPDPHSFKQTGPDPTLLGWMTSFMEESKRLRVPLKGITHHEYVEVDATSFTSPSKLDVTKAIAVAVNRTVALSLPGVAPWGGEIGPHNGGSVPCDHSSMRWANFGDSFWYADALGTKARHGYAAFCRQDLIGADYGLVDCSTGEPLPDYWAGLLFARLMGPVVLDAAAITFNSTAIRAYAHCTPKPAARGTATVLLINLSTHATNVTLTFPGSRSGIGALSSPHGDNARTEWHLTQSSHSLLTNATGLLGDRVQLNGAVLSLTQHGELPKLPGRRVAASEPVALAGESIAFAVVPVGIAAAGCMI